MAGSEARDRAASGGGRARRSEADARFGVARRVRAMLSHGGVVGMLALFAAGTVAVALNTSATILLAIPLGILAQMLNEYAIHRFVFHRPAPRSQFWFDVMYRLHYGHHDFPSAEKLLFVPTWFALPMAVVNFALFWMGAATLGVPDPLLHAVAIVLVGGAGTFLAYEWFHMTAHLPVRRTAIERSAASSHARHHFRDFQANYHVTPGGEIVDRLFGTELGAEELTRRSRDEFMTTLGLRPDDPRLVSARRRIARGMGVTPVEMERQGRARGTARVTA